MADLHFAFIGFGELGQRFARDLLLRKAVRVSAYDLKFDEPAQGRLRREAVEAIGVRPARSAADACQSADVIVSAVTADQTFPVVQAAAEFVRPGQLFLDVNSASPETKCRAADAMVSTGAHYVEGAVMGAVLKPGITVEILTGGPHAERAAMLLNPLGMNLKPTSRDYGKASATKLCRSIVMKGLEALMVECSAASKHWGVEAPVYQSLDRTYKGLDFAALADDMNERVSTHGVRRAAEMREAADMLDGMGLNSDLMRAVAALHDRTAKPKV
jgi:3-hydroxyisobutyrate dehydrogenase-like beta-hydroxyacid dehydrogenase